jgi:hypothetical protein
VRKRSARSDTTRSPEPQTVHYKRTGSLAEVAELLGDSKNVARDHYVYALTTDYREVDRSIALARLAA